ncbi:MAG: cell envelope integrity protein TolA [Pseudohongiellaceae bacterium]|nr:cell envelope integrity protein TolA [Pseudohongiellaceae bacterium]
MTAFNGYPLSILLAILLHSCVIGALLFFQRAETQVIEIVQPPSVKANLVAENPQARNERVQEQRQAQRIQEQRDAERREEQRRQQQREAERQEQLRQQQQAEREAEQRRVAQLEREREAQRQADQQRAAEQRQREEQARAEQERRRQQELAEQQRRQREEQARQQAQAQAAAQQAAADGEAVMSYTTLIHDLVQQNWSRPPSARNGMVAVLRIRMVPTGDILDVEIVQSSGDYAFDRAAEQAVYRVNRFTELQGMPTRLFDRNFRSFLLTFRPEDLLN